MGVGYHRLQAAMEYLMSYGWAILVIGIVLGVMYSLGIFTPSYFAPKAPPGSCQVFRPSGPESIFEINLEGDCSNEVPEYVAQFNSNQSNVTTLLAGSPNISSSDGGSITFLAWASLIPTDHNQVLFQYASGSSYYPNIRMLSDKNCGGTATDMLPIYYGSSSTFVDDCLTQITEGTFMFYAIELNGTELTGYDIYNNHITPYAFAIPIGSNVITSDARIYIGGGPGAIDWKGFISNVQVYNTTLSSNEILAQYVAGLGGDPIDLKNLIAWYPLNGNANDYSGNGNNGVPLNVTYMAGWYNSYSSP